MNRAKSSIGGGDFGVGIEAGLVWSSVLSDHFDVQYWAGVDRSGRITVVHGPGFAHPPRIPEKVRAGATVGDAQTLWTGMRPTGSLQSARRDRTDRLLP